MYFRTKEKKVHLPGSNTDAREDTGWNFSSMSDAVVERRGNHGSINGACDEDEQREEVLERGRVRHAGS